MDELDDETEREARAHPGLVFGCGELESWTQVQGSRPLPSRVSPAERQAGTAFPSVQDSKRGHACV